MPCFAPEEQHVYSALGARGIALRRERHMSSLVDVAPNGAKTLKKGYVL